MISIGWSVTAARSLAERAASFFFPVTTLSVTTADGSQELGGRCCFVFLSRHNAIGDHRLVSVHGGGVLHDDLLRPSVSVMSQPFAQHRYCPRVPVSELQVFRARLE